MDTIIYKDLNTDVQQDSRGPIVVNMDAVNNKVMNLLKCPLGSRFRQDEFGTSLNYYLHQPCDDITASDIKQDFIQAIRRWIPEVTLLIDQCSVTAYDNGIGFSVVLVYFVPKLKSNGNLNFSALKE